MGDDTRDSDRAIRSLLDRSSLTAERERALLIAYHTAASDRARHAALSELWESHTKLVVGVAARFRRRGTDFSDLVGAGQLGLHAAIARFDIARPECLASFAVRWIRGAIWEHLRRHGNVLRLPESDAYRQLACSGERLLRAARAACERDGVEPTDTELHIRIGARIGLDATEVETALALLDGGILAMGDGWDGGTPTWDDVTADGADDPENEAIQRIDSAKAGRRALALADEVLGERERAVFMARCVPDLDDIVTLEVLAARFGVSMARVHQLERSARGKIATALMNEGYRAPSATPPPDRRRAEPRPARGRFELRAVEILA